jgi:hypothetical protein
MEASEAVVFISRGSSSKGNMGKVFQNKGRSGPNVRNIPANLSKRVAQKLIQMRLSGKTQAECNQWLEDAIQEIERLEGEYNG